MTFRILHLFALVTLANCGLLAPSPLIGSSLLGSQLVGSPLVRSSLLGSPLLGSSLVRPSLLGSPLVGPSLLGSPLVSSQLISSPVSKIAIGASPLLTKSVNLEVNAYPKYSFGYDIQDGLTGDIKNQQESRDGDVVVGSYSLIDADGKKRIVQYQADAVNGFNAVVNRIPLTQKVIASAPIVTKIASPAIGIAPSIWNGARPSVWNGAGPSVWNGAGPSVWNGAGQSVWNGAGPSVWNNGVGSVWNGGVGSVWNGGVSSLTKII